ncbi:MAG: DNA adenine methylase [Alphaproteobacteria bacterium]|uniref:site-specific DNA-methyltransferase (adenine-specific) n=1 Tax=Candidatus Nitrobium versatile TaxID=2884831 RepID=A0A953M1B1_9BACT|nr:DNA adenine methylase [Candidatus Nitrobium versatile]
MTTASPLRYPGGKSAMAGLLGQIRRLNGLGGRAIAEPFAGGAGASLALLYLEETHKVLLNDADPAIHDFWWSLINRPKVFIDMLTVTRVDMHEWYHQRDIYRESCGVDRVRRGFSAFYLNRCNRSGIIINGGPIGGVQQNGNWKLDARFNKADLQRRCEKVAEYRDRIRISCCDGIEFIDSIDPVSSFFFIDPPYFVKGSMLYLNALKADYHANLADHLKSISDSAWVLTYDDCPEIRRMYDGWATIRPFTLRYSAAERRSGKEILIVPRWMHLPTSQGSAAITW